jgi:hypothetical protein
MVFDINVKAIRAMRIVLQELDMDRSAEETRLPEAGRLDHPNSSRIYGVERIDGRLAIVTPLTSEVQTRGCEQAGRI